MEFAIDLAAGRPLVVPTVAAPDVGQSAAAGKSAAREFAQVVLQRVKPHDVCEILDIGLLCQPLWTFPCYGNVAGAKAALRTKNNNKWDSPEWLICSELY